jgi:hypothetical protein
MEASIGMSATPLRRGCLLSIFGTVPRNHLGSARQRAFRSEIGRVRRVLEAKDGKVKYEVPGANGAHGVNARRSPALLERRIVVARRPGQNV